MKKSKTLKNNIGNLEVENYQLELLYQKILEKINKLYENKGSSDGLIKSFQNNSDIERKINDMYAIHFPTNRLKRTTQRERFLAQILLTPTKKIFR